MDPLTTIALEAPGEAIEKKKKKKEETDLPPPAEPNAPTEKKKKKKKKSKRADGTLALIFSFIFVLSTRTNLMFSFFILQVERRWH